MLYWRTAALSPSNDLSVELPLPFLLPSLILLSPQDLLADHISDLFVRFSDPLPTKRARLRILVALANPANIQTLLKELLVRRSRV